MSSIKQTFIPIAALCAAFISADAGAEGPGDFSDDYPYLVVDQALPDVVREFGHNLDMSVDVSQGIKGRLRRYEHNGTAGEFLDYLEAEHQLDWVLDGKRLYFSSSKEQIARSWSANASAVASAEAALEKARIDDPRYPIGIDQDRGQISLTAPPRYMALAAPIIDRALAPKATRTVNVIHGRARAGGT